MFLRTENFRTFIKMYPVVTTILAINLGIYLVYLIGFQLLHIYAITDIYTFGYGFNFRVAVYHEWWRLITPMFLHLSFEHVLFNCFSIFLFAPALESLLGKWKFCIAYFGSGILGNVFSLFFGGLTQAPYIGASGAIFGLFGIFVFIIVLRRHLIDKQSVQIITVILIANIVWSIIMPKLDFMGHMFGLLAGFLLGPILLFRTRANGYKRQ